MAKCTSLAGKPIHRQTPIKARGEIGMDGIKETVQLTAIRAENRSRANECQSHADTAKKRLVLTVMAFALAAIYSICFTGLEVRPCLSSTVFIFAAILSSVAALRILGLEKRKGGYLWMIPAGILGVLNAVFEYSGFNHMNCFAAFCFVTYAFARVSGGNFMPFSLDCLKEVARKAISFVDAIPFIKSLAKDMDQKRIKAVGQAALAALVSVPLILLILALLVSADSVFAYYLEEAIDNTGKLPSHAAAGLIVFAQSLGYIGHAAAKRAERPSKPLVVNMSQIMPCTFLFLLNLLFAAFCFIQIAFLFTGGYRALPEGIIYSEYAKEGFFQLLFVTVINFGVLITCLTVVNGGQAGKWMNILLIFLSVFTAVLIASSFYRMSLYIEAYRFTSLRMLVLTFLALETALVAITLAYLISRLRRKGFDFIHVGGIVCVAFYIIANATGARTTADALNIASFKSKGDSSVFSQFGNGRLIDINNFSKASSKALIGVLSDPAYAGSDYDTMRESIKNKIDIIKVQYESDAGRGLWQNWSIAASRSEAALEKFGMK
jgi:hypothetical protein